MKERTYIASAGRFCLTYEEMLKPQWRPLVCRFQRNGWHLYLWKLRLTRSSISQPKGTF